MNKELSSVVTLILFSMALVFLMPNVVIAADSDSDGLENPSDNCIRVPNGPILGTCTAGDSRGAFCSSNGECGTGGFCSKGQEDADLDGVGDACDYCAGDGGYDMDEDGYCDGEDNCPWVNNPDQNAEVCTGGIQMFTKFDTFEGTWSEIGRQIGNAYPDNIIDFANIFTVVLEAMGPPGWTPQSYYDAIEDLMPQSVKDHIQGMALGLFEVRSLTYQRAWEMVLVGNMAIELLNMSESTGCTAFAVSSEAGTFLCHNTDATKMAGNYSVAMYWKPTNGDYSYITMDPPAWVNVSFGLNEKGIGITLNAGRPNINAAVGHPINLMVRYVMEHASTLDEAISYFQDYIDTPGNSYGTSGTILLLVDFKDSSMAKIQQRSEVIDVTYGEELKPGVTYVYGTNHFLGDFNPDPEYYSESSFKRLARLLEIMPQFDTYDLQTCLDILSDTNGGEASSNTISMDGGDRLGVGATQFSTIFTRENVYYTLQPPHKYLATYPGPVVLNYCDDGDDLELDTDSDGVVDCLDNCSDDPNPTQEDGDCDGKGNNCDNCINGYNPGQEDSDQDGIGDVCDETDGRICPIESIYGEHSAETELLRNFRDTVLSKTQEGEELVKLYYQWSPVIVGAMEADGDFKETIKELVDDVLFLIGP